MPTLVDTNVLLRLLQPQHPHSIAAERALVALRGTRETLNISPQNLIEFWVVATRAVSENGLGMTVQAASNELVVLRRLFTLLPDSDAVFHEWERLIVTHQVVGKNAHEAHLVAAMNVHGVSRILTFNVRDFSRYTTIAAIHPSAVS